MDVEPVQALLWRYDVEFLARKQVETVEYEWLRIPSALLAQLVEVNVIIQSGTVGKRRSCGSVWKWEDMCVGVVSMRWRYFDSGMMIVPFVLLGG